MPRGSLWRQWDLHIHTPASFHWNGERFGRDPARNTQLIDEMIEALNKAEPSVFALMDYWTFDGWFALKKRLSEKGAPVLTKVIFPGIELRLVSPMEGRLNAHVIFSNEISDQNLIDFKAKLIVERINRPLSDDSLMCYARSVGQDKLKHHGFNKDTVDQNDDKALIAGSTIAEINCDSYKKAISEVPHGMAIGFMPFNTNDGLADIKWQDHYAYVFGLFDSSPIFETRQDDTWAAFVGIETNGNAKWFENFQLALNNIPRLAVSGSDAHQFIGIKGDNNKRGYGDFPSDKITWIKADTTFQGLLQAIKEPAKRSFIGKIPTKLHELNSNKTLYIDSININKITAKAGIGEWLDGCNVQLNHDLVAIIGNKGSGKSALADIIALLGNSKRKSHFSFLKKDRFRGKSGEPAKHFEGNLIWYDGSNQRCNLNDDPHPDHVERVRYIPQGHFEELCNEHISGTSNAFEQELRTVIFSHTDESTRLGALDFEQLIEHQENSYRNQLSELRRDLKNINDNIVIIENQLQTSVKTSLSEQLIVKQREIDEHNKIKPIKIIQPNNELTEEQESASSRLEQIKEEFKTLSDSQFKNSESDLLLAKKLKAILDIQEQIAKLERTYNQIESASNQDFELLNFEISHLIKLSINQDPLDQAYKEIIIQRENIRLNVSEIENNKIVLRNEQIDLEAKLNSPQLEYQNNLKALEIWENKLKQLVGTPNTPETLEGLKARIFQIDELPAQHQEKILERLEVVGKIFDVLNKQRLARAELFKPVQDLIQNNKLIRDEYKLQFQATLSGSSDSLATSLFSLIKQNSGEFRGEDESFLTIRKIAETFDLNTRQGALDFVSELYNKILNAATSNNNYGINNLLRKDKSANDVYDLIFSLSFLEPRYTLLFQDTQIEQLSPGQRGALLLIFYLLVDKGKTPIILDQPEENLDNATVVSLLVPVLTEAKKRRQVIMVTHNPNLAIVCDAEQVIYSSFDRKNASKITYHSGSIENPEINIYAINILEGTKPAFNNRKLKYH